MNTTLRAALIAASLALVGTAFAAPAVLAGENGSGHTIHPSSNVTKALNAAIKNSGDGLSSGDPIQGSGNGGSGAKSDPNPKG